MAVAISPLPAPAILPRPRQAAVGILLAICDMSVAFVYAINISVVSFYMATLVFKLLLVAAIAPTSTPRPNVINCSLIVLLLISGFAGIHNLAVFPADGAQLLGFCLHLILTGNALEAEDIRPYSTTVAFLLGLVVALYLWEVRSGKIRFSWGMRYNFLGNTQPNLGGEIILAGVFLSGFGLSRFAFLCLSLFSIPALLLLQARSALLAVGYLQLVCIGFFVVDWKSRIGKLLAICATIAVAFIFAKQIVHIANLAFELDSAGRGVDSGFSGRTELWRFAMNAFLDSPIFGQGYGFFDSVKNIGPHNLFLFVISENGLLGAGILVWLANAILRLGRSREIIWFSSFGIMAMFNDRFINLDPYPFFYYAMLWIPAEFVIVRCLYGRA